MANARDDSCAVVLLRLLNSNTWDRLAGTVICYASWLQDMPQLGASSLVYTTLFSVSLMIQCSHGFSCVGMLTFKQTPESRYASEVHCISAGGMGAHETDGMSPSGEDDHLLTGISPFFSFFSFSGECMLREGDAGHRTTYCRASVCREDYYFTRSKQ